MVDGALQLAAPKQVIFLPAWVLGVHTYICTQGKYGRMA